MQRIVILGGGVGGTLTANLLVKRLRSRIDRGAVEIVVVDATGTHVYQPGFMYIAMGGERAERLERPERSLLDHRVSLLVGEVERVDPTQQRVFLKGGEEVDYDFLVIASGARIVPEAIEHFDTEAHHFYTAEAALALRHALDRFDGGRIVIGIAGMPYKCPPAPLEVAFLIEAELRERHLAGAERAALLLAHRARVHHRERQRNGNADPASARASSSTRSSTSRRSIPSARSSRASRARSCRTTC